MSTVQVDIAEQVAPTRSANSARRRVTAVLIVAATFAAFVIGAALLGQPLAFAGLGKAGSAGGYPIVVALLIFFTAGLCEFVDSAVGMGYGTTLTPVLLLIGFEPARIVPAVLLSELLTGLVAAAMHHRDGNVDWLRERRSQKAVALLSMLTLVGVAGGAVVSMRLSQRGLTAMISIIVLTMAGVILATRGRRAAWRPGRLAAVGSIAAFCKTVSGGGYGPLVTAGQVVSGVPARAAVAITSMAEAFACAAGLVAFWIAGRSLDWRLTIPLLAGALCSVPLATLTVSRTGEARMRTAVAVAAGVLAVVALAKFFF